MYRARKGVKAADRGRRGPFAALVRAATEDPSAAIALASAYGLLSVGDRRRMVDAVRADARAEGVKEAAALIPLLAVEEDLDLANMIATIIRAASGEGLSTGRKAQAHLMGDEDVGELVLVRPLHGRFDERIRVRWDVQQGTAEVDVTPMTEVPAVAERATPLPHQVGVDLLARVLWRQRRMHGRLPNGLSALSALL